MDTSTRKTVCALCSRGTPWCGSYTFSGVCPELPDEQEQEYYESSKAKAFLSLSLPKGTFETYWSHLCMCKVCVEVRRKEQAPKQETVIEDE